VRPVRDVLSGLFRNWILAVLVVNGVSVVIDVTDVARYCLGDRDPQVMPE
jgi:CBS domain-containing protein